MYILLSGNAPFLGTNPSELQYAIENNEVAFTDPIWKKISVQTKDLIAHMLVKDPVRRWSAFNCIRHTFIVMPDLD